MLPRFLRSPAAVVLSVGIVCVLAVAFSEKVAQNDGLGWDGLLYGRWTISWPEPLTSGTLHDYFIRRILPSAVVHYGLRAVGAPLETATVIRGFEVAAVIIVVGSAWTWTAIARRLTLSPAGLWLGAVVLFGNHAVLKWTAYYPVLGDVWSVGLGLLQLLLFLDRRPLVLAAVNVVGAFTWPNTLVLGTALLVFMPLKSAPAPAGRAPLRLHLVAAVALTVAWVFLCAHVLRVRYDPETGTDPIYGPLVRLSVVVSAAFLLSAVAVLLDDRALFSPRHVLAHLLRPHILLAAATYAGVTLLQARVAPGRSVHATNEAFAIITAFTALQKPAAFVIAHVMFLGPIVLVMLARARALVALLRRTGPGLIVLALVGTLMFLNSETRRLWNVLAMLTPFAVQLVDRAGWGRRDLLLFAGLTLFSSRVWLRYDVPAGAEVLTFPGQLMFMTLGPWMSMSMYLLQVPLVVAMAVWVLRLFRDADRARALAAPAPVPPDPAPPGAPP